MGNYLINDKFVFDKDIVNLVLQSVNYGSVWKNIRSVSKQIYNLSLKYQESKLIELANPILTLIYRYPNTEWGYETLSFFDIFTIDFVRLTYNTIPWTKEMISRSSNITINDVINANSDSIDWYYISMNPSIKVSDMLKYDHLPWEYDSASMNTSIKIEDVRNNLDKGWDHFRLVQNKSLSIEDLSTIIDLTNNNIWWANKNATYKDYIKYSTYTDIYNIYDIKRIIKYFQLDEDTLQKYLDMIPNINNPAINMFLSHFPITPKIVKNNPNINWSHILPDYSKFTIEDFINLLYKHNPLKLLKHPDFTIKDFFKYFDIDTFGYWYLLSKSSWLTFDIVLEYKDIIPWDHYGLSRNPNVTVDILDNSDFSWIKWNYKYISKYAKLNFIYIVKHNDKDWSLFNLAMNKSLNRS